MMKTLFAIALTGAAAVGCSDSVDRNETRDSIKKTFTDSGLAADDACIDTALDEYSDKELIDIDKQLASGDNSGAAGELVNALVACASATS